MRGGLGVALATLGALVLGLVALAAVLVASNPRADVLEVVLPAISALSFAVCGLIAWWRRPHNRVGVLLVGTGVAFVGSGLQYCDIDALVALGLIVATLPVAITVHLLLAFPSGRLSGTRERAVVAAGYFVTLVLQAPYYLIGDAESDVLRVGTEPGPADAFSIVQGALGTLVMLASALLLAGRIRRAARPDRRGLGPVPVYGILALAAVVLAASAVKAGAPSDISPWVGAFQTLVLTALPIVFVVGLLRGSFARAGELHELAASLGDEATGAGTLRDALSRALGDDSLAVAYRRADGDGYVDERGEPVALPDSGPRRVAEVALDDRAVGAIVYDATLIADRGLVADVAGVAALAIDHQRVTAELRASARELRASRERIVEAGDAERRRIARDLHDGAQQRIVLLGMQAGQLARRPGDAERTTQRAGELRDGLTAVIDELRDLVHGIMPAPLIEHGLPAAATWLADRLPFPVEVEVAGLDGRLRSALETTAYFVVAESLTNTAKYARAGEATVTLERIDDQLRVEVRDDGAGGADPERGSGLRGLGDRVAALGGSLAVESPAGGGTVVRAELPCES